jgi:hypothetical protein
MIATSNGIMIGAGRLTWTGSERRSDRYGYVFLINSGDSTTKGTDWSEMVVRPEHLGLRCRLLAHVIETRQSSHIGDLFHGVYPSTPEIGDTILLGVGLLSVISGREGKPLVGLMPFDDDRSHMWLDIKALYRCHEQTVQLYYEPLELPNAD